MVDTLEPQGQEVEYQEKYLVLINHEEQYSIWPSYKPIPGGWKAIGNPQSKQECLDYIDKTWVDMRPLSLRNAMAELAGKIEGTS